MLDELGDEVGGEVRTLGDLERWEVGTVTLWDLSDITKGLDGTVNDTTSFWVSDGLGDLDETWEELGDERSDGVLVIDELGHVVSDDSNLSLDGGGSLVKTSRKKRSHEGEGRSIDFGNEGGG